MKAPLKNFIKILIFLLLIKNIATQKCNLNYNDPGWLNDWRLLLVKDNNNEYQLFRSDSVPTNSEVYLKCNNEPRLTTARCLKNQRFNLNLPLSQKCDENDAVQFIRLKEKVSYCAYTLYKFGYKIRIEGKEHFFETYRVCFDEKYMRTVFTINKAYPVGGGRPDFLFNPDDIFYGKYFYAFTQANIFKRFNTLLGKKQNYMDIKNSNHIINRGHLTPCADFTLTNLKRSTFQMVNAMPEFKTIDNGNWRLIEQWARHPTRTPSNICTGVLGQNLDKSLDYVLTLKHSVTNKLTPIFLTDDRKIPIPLWIYKIVDYQGTKTVFLTLNNIYHKGAVQVPSDVCNEVKCPLKLPRNVQMGYTFCCEYNHFITKNVPNLQSVC
ncbi:salivary protein Tsal2A-like [Cochliomyia hominivorax]